MAETAGLVALSVLWTFGETRPIGLSLGGTLERELAEWRPDAGRPAPEVAGVIGIDARFELRSLRTPWLLVGAVGGVAGPEIRDSGWTPVWEALIESGLAFSPEVAGMHVGARLGKDLSPCFVGCEGGTGLVVRASLGTEVTGGLARMRTTPPTASVGAAVRLTSLQSDL